MPPASVLTTCALLSLLFQLLIGIQSFPPGLPRIGVSILKFISGNSLLIEVLAHRALKALKSCSLWNLYAF